jgi:hypothetical protein
VRVGVRAASSMACSLRCCLWELTATSARPSYACIARL